MPSEQVPRLSSPVAELRPEYDAIVVGSGYGASVLALRLAQAGRKVCVLERGREWLPGEFPRTGAAFAREVQAELEHGRVGSPTGLYRFHMGEGVTAVQGCGLGGGSLVNAGVAVRPEPRIFEDPRWPAAFRADVGTRLERGYAQAEEMLRPARYEGALSKLTALDRAARALGTNAQTVPVTIAFEKGTSAAGVPQAACTLCGNCITGCNHGAKGALTTNYLAAAKQLGAELFCEIEVRSVSACEGRWVVHYRAHGQHRERFHAPDAFVTAPMVLLGGGALGSTEVLLRSRDAGLPVSAAVGQGFSGNGCTIGFGHNGDDEVNGIGSRKGGPEFPGSVGPAIAGMIDLRKGKPISDGMVIQESAVPGPIGAALPLLLATAHGERGPAGGALARLSRAARSLMSLVGGPGHGALRRTQAWAVTAHDSASGALRLEHDQLRLRWAGAGAEPCVKSIHQTLARASRAQGAEYIANPAWQVLPSHPTTTPHPLGGCPMGEDAAHGAVDDRGRVFKGSAGTEVHEGLYVCDSSVLPCPLSANPLLTLTAMAERCASLLVEEHGWTAATAPARRTLAPASHRKTGFRFTEHMQGQLDLAHGDAGTPFEFVLTVEWEDVRALLAQPSLSARSSGTATAPALSPHPLTAFDGRFQLFVPAEGDARTLRMIHAVSLKAEDGRAFHLQGVKVLHDDPGPDLWVDSTTLFFTLSEGAAPGGRVLGTGHVRVHLWDLLTQATTLGDGRAGMGADLIGQAQFLKLFLGTLRQVYGGLVLPLVR